MSERKPVSQIESVDFEIPYREDDLVLAQVRAFGRVPNSGYNLPQLDLIDRATAGGYLAFRMTAEAPARGQIVANEVKTLKVETMVPINPARCSGAIVYSANGSVKATCRVSADVPSRDDTDTLRHQFDPNYRPS